MKENTEDGKRVKDSSLILNLTDVDPEDRSWPKDLMQTAEEMYIPFDYKPDAYGMYEAIDAAFDGIHEYFEDLRRNEGRVGHAFSNRLIDMSKDVIRYSERDEDDDANKAFYAERAMKFAAKALKKASANGEIAETGNKFLRMSAQEQLEGILHRQIWPVITGKASKVPKLINWQEFWGTPQAFTYAFLDLTGELSKSLNKRLRKAKIGTEAELQHFERYLDVVEAMVERLSDERHYPGYVIDNGFSRFSGFSKKLRNAESNLLRARDSYNLRQFEVRLHEQTIARVEEMLAKSLKG